MNEEQVRALWDHMNVAQQDQFSALVRDAVPVIRRICEWMAEHEDDLRDMGLLHPDTDPDG